MIKTLILMMLAIFFATSSHVCAQPLSIEAELKTINPDSYPAMDAKEVGHMLYSFKIAEQALDDFSLIPLTDMYGIPGTGNQQGTMSSARYTLGFMAYFLALEQFHKIPAWTEAIQPRYDRIIQKMLQRKTWAYWAEASKGLPIYEPGLNTPYPEEHDPIAHKNIMYSGHLAQMIALYEKLYGDMKWSKPDALVFTWSDDEIYRYDAGALMKLIYDQFIEAPSQCIECHPNSCFPVCNQHPLLALMVYDQVHGTRYFAEAADLVLDWYLKNDLIDPVDHTVVGMYLVKQHSYIRKRNPTFGNVLDLVLKPMSMMGLVGLYSSAIDGWNGVFMNAWAPDLIKEHYPYQVRNSVVVTSDKMAHTRKIGVYDQLSAPFFAAMAAEMGDIKLRDQLLNWSERTYKSRFDNEGNYYYPAWAEIPLVIWPGYSVKGIPMTDKVAAIARANTKDGMRDLHVKPFVGADAQYPQVTGVDIHNVILTRAQYDAARHALIITTKPSVGHTNDKTSFTISRLSPHQKYYLAIDNKVVATYQGGERVAVTVPLERKHHIILLAR